MLEQIRLELKTDVDETRVIPAERVKSWMSSTEPDVRGATYAFLHSRHVARVLPAVSFDEVFDYILGYFEWCIRSDPAPGGWANTRYSAGWDLVGWFLGLWDQGHEKRYFDAIKSRLASLYSAGEPELKKAIEHAVIEHLFERKQVRKFFADWESDPLLKPAYDEGMLWVTHGGKSPLSGSEDEIH
jgi:hypothetical protein